MVQYPFNLATKFVLGAIVLTIVPMLIIGTIGFSLGRSGIFTHTDLHLQSVVALKQEEIQTWLELQRTLINSHVYPGGSSEVISELLTSPVGTEAYASAETRFRHLLDILVEAQPAIQDILVIDGEGTIVFAKEPDWVGESRVGQAYYDQAEERFAVSIDTGKWEGQKASLVISEPTHGPKAGVVAVDLDPTPFQKLLMADPGLGERGRIYLLQQGVGAITQDGIMDRTSELDAMEVEVDSTESLTFVGLDGVEVIGRAAGMDGLPWIVVASIPTEDAFATVAGMRTLMILSLLVAGGAGAVGAWRYGRTITKSLKEAVAGAKAIGAGRLDLRLPIVSRDEVGELAASFNQMAEDLSRLRAELGAAEREAALHELSDRVLQAAPISLVVVTEGGVVAANDLFCRTFDFKMETAMGRPLQELLELGGLKSALETSLKHKTAYRGQWEWQDALGRARQFSVTINEMGVAESQEHAHVLVALDEITERLAAEWRYRYLMENANDGVFIINASSGKVVEASSRAAEMLDYPSNEDLVGVPVVALHHPDALERAEQRFRETIEKSTAVFDDVPFLRRDGSSFDALISASLVDFGDEKLIYSLARDISVEKAAEDALRESEERLQSVLQSTNDAIIVTDERSYVHLFNRGAEHIFGWLSEEIVGRTIDGLLPPEALVQIRRAMANYSGSDEQTVLGRTVEMEALRKNGERFPIETSLGKYDAPDGPFFVAAIRDITERKEAEGRLRETSRLASLGELAAGVAHEVNNPLTTVVGFSELLLARDLPASVMEPLQRISTDAKRAAKIVQNLLSFARRREPEKTYVDITGVLEKALELKAYDFRVNNIHVVKNWASELPKTMMDEHQVLQVIMNILSNAEQAMTEAHGRGQITLATGVHADRIVVSIADDGPGITPESVGKLFDPFFTTKEVGKGTGLGLSISYGIIQQHGGTLRAESVPGEGATFYVELPIEGAEPESDSEDSDAPGMGTRGQRILVVDDEPGIRELVKEMLTNPSRRIDIAETGQKAWEMVRANAYDCILMDMKMPGMSGGELFHKIEQLDSKQAEKVIIMTGDTINAETREFISSVANPVLSKPFDLSTLQQAVDSVVEAAAS